MDSEFLRDIELPNTLALPARAQRALVAVSTAQLQARLPSMTEERVFVLGSGSNVVLPDALPGLTVLMRICLLYTSPSPRDKRQSRMPSSA